MFNNIEEYKKMADLMPGSVILFQWINNKLKLLHYTDKAQKLTGLTRQELDSTTNEDGLNLILQDDIKVINMKINEACEKNEELDVLYRQHHKVHGFIWVHMNASIIGEHNGIPVFLATMLDVTHEMQNSYGIMESSDRSICVIEKNTKLLLYANSKFYELIHLKPSESMGIYCYDALCGNKAFKNDDNCLCFSTIDIEKPFEYYNPDNQKYLSMYGRNIMWGEHEAYVFYLTDQTAEKFKDKQLKSAQERFEMTLDNSDLFIWEYDIVNSLCINPDKAVREYGLPKIIENYPEALYDMGHTPPETVAQIKEAKMRLLNGETGFSMERRTVNSEGKSQWMKVEYSLEKDANGRPIRALMCGTDITRQKERELHYEEELRRKKTVASDTKILAILDLVQDTVTENDAANAEFTRLLQLGSVNRVMNAVCEHFIVPSDWEQYKKHFNREKMLSDYKHGIFHGSFRHQFVHVSGWYESAYDLLLNPSNGHVEAIATMKDVTDLVRSEQVVNKIASIDYDSIITIDTESSEMHSFDNSDDSDEANKKADHKQNYGNVYRDFITKYCTDANIDQVLYEMSRKHVIESLDIYPIYTVMYSLNIDGRVMRKRNIYTYLDQSHKTVLCARQDITDIYKKEEEQKEKLASALKNAEAANKAKTSFLSTVSHDMRTPLNGILGLTHLLLERENDENKKKDLTQLEDSGLYLLNLINDTLDVGKIESGKMELHPMVVEGKSIVAGVLAIIRQPIAEKQIDFQMHMGNLPFTKLYVDVGRMEQVLINIIGNAVKFTPSGGKIDFYMNNLSVENGVIKDEVIIKDTGIGMSTEYVERIFEPFSQENQNNKTKYQGTGLGMTITKQIVKLMGGEISVESEIGKGTTVRFTICLPVATEKQIKDAEKNTDFKASKVKLSGKRILLCEDHPLNADIATRLLQKKGIIVERAENGRIGYEKFMESQVGYYDMILMDIRMPEMDGFEATEMIRSSSHVQARIIPIVAMTANAFDSDVNDCIQKGMNAHISKPVDPKILFGVISEELAKTKNI